MLLCLVVTLVVVGPTLSVQSESWLVNIDSGPVRGYRDPDYDIFTFYGIPYAKAPNGTKRFRAPLPAPVWSEPLEAVNSGILCPQLGLPSIIAKEDCLVANVFVPNTNATNLPVYVYVHGGAFLLGFGNMNRPRNLVSHSNNLIVVTFNYRLAAHGFLCLGTEDAPGNAGLKDQVALFRWVKNNIANFRGNPNDVTIGGASAGSISIDLMMISKMAKGLFNKIIPESGSHLCPFSVQNDPIKNAREYASNLNYTGSGDIYELQDFFQNLPYETLQVGGGNSLTPQILMAPCIERDIGEERFLEDVPLNILKKGDYEEVPVLAGFANMEGSLQLPLFYVSKDKMNANFGEFLPEDLQFKSQNERDRMASEAKKLYFGDNNVSNETILSYLDYYSDIMFACPTLRSINLQLQVKNISKIYLYEYAFVDDDTPVVPHTTFRGADHTAQSFAIFDGVNITHPDESIITNEHREMKRTIRELWQNFIVNGKPESSRAPEWLPVGNDWSPHMKLEEVSQLQGSLLKERCQFWERVYEEFYRPPIPPQPSSAGLTHLSPVLIFAVINALIKL